MIGQGCWRLASRISAIRKHGWNVEHVVLPGNFREYYLPRENQRVEDDRQGFLPLEVNE